MRTRGDPREHGRGARDPAEGVGKLLIMLTTSGVTSVVIFACRFISGVHVTAETTIFKTLHWIVVIVDRVAVVALPNGGAAMIFEGLEALFHALSKSRLGFRVDAE